MRPKKPQTTGEGDLFRAQLDHIVNMRHELVQLASKIDWDWIDDEIAPLYSDKGRPGSRPASSSGCCCSSVLAGTRSDSRRLIERSGFGVRCLRQRSSSPSSSGLHQGMSALGFCQSTSGLDVVS